MIAGLFVYQKAGRDKVAILGMDVNLLFKKHSYRLLKLFISAARQGITMTTATGTTWRQRLEAYYYLCRFDKPIGTELVFYQPCGHFGLHQKEYRI